MDIKSNEMLSCIKQYSTLQTRINEHPLNKNLQLKYLYEQYERKANLERQVLEAKNDLKKAQSLLQIGDLKKYKRVLRRLGYCNSTDVIDLKGRVACEIDTGDELVTTELLFNGVFNDLTVSQSCALLSCFVFQEKVNEMPKLPQELSGPLRLMQVYYFNYLFGGFLFYIFKETARRVARVSIESKLDIDEERYVDGFKPYMMDVVKAWVDGQSFASICKMTSIYEGNK
jgi:ATP-dependent RNA helicase DOB1